MANSDTIKRTQNNSYISPHSNESKMTKKCFQIFQVTYENIFPECIFQWHRVDQVRNKRGTSMHSSRMRTARLLTYPRGVCIRGVLHRGGLLGSAWGVCTGGVHPGRVCPGGLHLGGLPIPRSAYGGLGQTPREQND